MTIRQAADNFIWREKFPSMGAKMSRLLSTMLAFAVALLAFTPCALAQSASEPPDFTPEEQAFIDAHSTYTIGFRQSGKPVTYLDQNGELQGITAALAKKIEEKSGLKFNFVLMDKDYDVTGAFARGDMDIIMTFSDKSSFDGSSNGVFLTTPMLSVPMVLVTDGKAFANAKDGKLTYVIKKGFVPAEQFIAKNSPGSEITYVQSDKLDDTLAAIEDGKADATFMNNYTVSYLLQNPHYANLRIIPQVYFTQYLCLGVGENENPLLLQVLNKTIGTLSDEEIQDVVLANTAGVNYELTFGDIVYMYWLQFALAAVIVILLILLAVGKSISARKAMVANDAKNEFVSRMSHDVRSPIGAISTLTSFAREDIDDREKLLGDLANIEISNTFLLSLVNDVLEISKVDSGKVELHPEPYLCSDYQKSIQTIMRPMCQQKNIAFEMDMRTDTEDVAVLVDKVRLNQIVLNILSNAVKYTQNGGTVTYISDSRKLDNGNLLFGFIIADTGIGMSKQFQKRMFDQFSMETDNPLRQQGMTGTGLGLSIVKKLVDLMDGTIDIESELGEGTKFKVHIELPDATRQYHQQRTCLADESCELESKRLTGTILMAEDDAINAAIACRMLEGFGLTVVHVTDGKQAVARFANSDQGEYSAILMDIRMPLMNGYEATQAIRKLKRPDAVTVPIIAMTADAFKESVDKAGEVGMDEHLTKPVKPEGLYRALAKYITTA